MTASLRVVEIPEHRSALAVASPTWRFITNHAAVLLCTAQQPTLRVREIAGRVGITERATLAILNDLITGGYVRRRRESRHNVYEVHPEAPLRHPVWRGGPSVGWLLRLPVGDGHERPASAGEDLNRSSPDEAGRQMDRPVER